MFTGLIQEIGRVVRFDRQEKSVEIDVATEVIDTTELIIGESIAVDGICLTVTSCSNNQFTVTAGDETLARTTLGTWKLHTSVNIERALQMGDRLGGHMVLGHIDGVGSVQSHRQEEANYVIVINMDDAMLRYVVKKGSISIDGISLTVNTVDKQGVSVALIPHTVNETTLAKKEIGALVNIEVDIIGKYVETLLKGYKSSC